MTTPAAVQEADDDDEIIVEAWPTSSRRAPVACAVAAPPADPYALVAVHCRKVSADRLEPDEEHRSTCKSPGKCQRCGFWFAFVGVQQGRSGRWLPPLAGKAFKSRFVFVDAVCGKKSPWQCTRPASWGGPWAWGCIPCNRAGATSVFAHVECRDSVTSSACKQHPKTMVHQRCA
jgi:hypothetical protein